MANEIMLKYGCNPNQKPSRIYMEDGSELPVKVINGKPGYINFWMHLTAGACKGAERSNRTSGSNFLQACISGGCGCGTSA